MRQWLYDNWGHLAGITMLVAAAIASIQIAFFPAFAADEIAFFIWSYHMLLSGGSHGIWSPLFRLNEAGYGSSYWTLYVNLINWFGTDAFWILRSLSCIAFIGIPISIAFVGNMAKSKYGYLLAGLWLTMPIAWWFGKITGPETFSLAFAVIGILLLFMEARLREKINPRLLPVAWVLGWLLIGVSVSLKLTMMPSAIFAFLMTFAVPQEEGQSQNTFMLRMLQGVGLMAFGFLLTSPIALFDSATFITRITTLPGGEAWSWSIAKASLTNGIWGWDGVFSGGLVQWSLCPLAFLVLATFYAIKQQRVFLILLVSFVACWLMIVSKGALLGWYWFGWIPMVVLGLLWLIKPNESNRGLATVVTMLILINVVFQAPEILERYDMKMRQGASLAQLSVVQQEITKATNQTDYDLILDYWEVSHVGGLNFPNAQDTELLQMTPPETNFVSVKPSSYNVPDATFNPRVVEAKAFVRIQQLGEHGTEGQSVLVVISKRLASKHFSGDFEQFLTERVIPKSPAQTTYSRLIDLPETAVYEIHSVSTVARAQSSPRNPL